MMNKSSAVKDLSGAALPIFAAQERLLSAAANLAR
jgi:hypothetical protein